MLRRALARYAASVRGSAGRAREAHAVYRCRCRVTRSRQDANGVAARLFVAICCRRYARQEVEGETCRSRVRATQIDHDD